MAGKEQRGTLRGLKAVEGQWSVDKPQATERRDSTERLLHKWLLLVSLEIYQPIWRDDVIKCIFSGTNIFASIFY